jgi:hypothetical protein
VQEHLTMRLLSVVALVTVVAAVDACGRSGGDAEKRESATSASKPASSDSARRTLPNREDTLPLLATIAEVAADGECPDPGPSAAADIAAQAAATIPLKVGLTLSHIWKANQNDYEHECLEQVVAIDARSVSTTGSCPAGVKGEKRESWKRRLCRADMANSYIYLTTEFYQTSVLPRRPETFRGALKFSMSDSSFAAFKGQGKTRHRYLDIDDPPDSTIRVDMDTDGSMVNQGTSTLKVIVNDTAVELPVVEGMLSNSRTAQLIRVKVLDDARFPMMLDYYHPAIHFFITYTKVSYPTEHGLEQQLAKSKRVDVYGIYFDFASDSLRPESAPILQEIATALASHPEWKLTITGHTDSVGGSASNLDLSRRRSARVRRALVEQYKTDSLRMTTSGSGDSQPKDVNSTPEGRARNRRVELVRD